jgi:mannose-6-phosphate isomerase-like protein (cupin superfamily)
MSDSVKIGKRIQTYREKLAMGVDDLSERTGLPAGLIKEFEAGRVTPAIGVMVKLSRALGQRVGTFLDDQIARDPIITRSVDREEGIAPHKENSQGHYRYHSLGTGKADRHMEPFFINISPTAERTNSSHEGEEFVVVVSGEVELVYGKETYLLKEGDTMYYNSLVPHCLSAVGGDAKIYAVIFTL